MPKINHFENTSDFMYASSEPYPTISISKPNPQYAQILSAMLASPIGEITNTMQYIYQSWLDYPSCDCALYNYHDIFSQISQVEMRHANILGQLIALLGVPPRFCYYKQRPIYWNSQYVSYNCNLPALLQEDIRHEQNAIHQYCILIDKICDPCIKAILERIVLDEKIHLSIFERLAEDYDN